jgi:hypothetical protein
MNATDYIRDRELRRLQWCVTQELRKAAKRAEKVSA